MESQRQQKVSRLIQKDLGEIFQLGARTLCLGAMVTVTKVYITPDLNEAKIYLSIFGVGEKNNALENIQKNSSQIRYDLGRKAGKQLRTIPELKFYEDDSLDYLENIEDLLKK
jgi:ribosome-binding factor A